MAAHRGANGTANANGGVNGHANGSTPRDSTHEDSDIGSEHSVSESFSLPDALSDATNSEDDEERKHLKRQRRDVVHKLREIETQFALIKERMFAARETALEREHQQIQQGTHPDLAHKMDEIEENRLRRLRFAEERRARQTRVIENKLEAWKKQAHDEFLSSRRTARKVMIEERQQKLMQLQREYEKSMAGLQDPAIDVIIRAYEGEPTHISLKKSGHDDLTTRVNAKVSRSESSALESQPRTAVLSMEPARATEAEIRRDVSAMLPLQPLSAHPPMHQAFLIYSRQQQPSFPQYYRRPQRNDRPNSIINAWLATGDDDSDSDFDAFVSTRHFKRLQDA